VQLVPADGSVLEGTIELVEAAGSEQHVHVRLEGEPAQRIVAVTPADARWVVGERVGLSFRPDRIHRFRAG
jgi:ABC-type sugar transport system ATPase subunit